MRPSEMTFPSCTSRLDIRCLFFRFPCLSLPSTDLARPTDGSAPLSGRGSVQTAEASGVTPDPTCMRALKNHLCHRFDKDLIYVFPAVRVFWCRSRSFVVLLNTRKVRLTKMRRFI
jgi:hypothetical protein